MIEVGAKGPEKFLRHNLMIGFWSTLTSDPEGPKATCDSKKSKCFLSTYSCHVWLALVFFSLFPV